MTRWVWASSQGMCHIRLKMGKILNGHTLKSDSYCSTFHFLQKKSNNQRHNANSKRHNVTLQLSTFLHVKLICNDPQKIIVLSQTRSTRSHFKESLFDYPFKIIYFIRRCITLLWSMSLGTKKTSTKTKTAGPNNKIVT